MILDMAKVPSKSKAQLEGEIKSVVGLFSDPDATRTFAREMRHELQKRQASERTTATLSDRPFEVRRMEEGRRVLFSRYRSEDEARQTAHRIDGWVERDGHII